MDGKLKVAVHKFASCDGCQLAFLNAGEDLLLLSELVEFVHFAEAGAVNEDYKVDIAIVEGSVCTPDDLMRINRIRNNSKFLITIGACATAGGLQALRNMANGEQWLADIYAQPEHVNSLATATSIAEHVKVDLELWGCPINARQLLQALRGLLWNSMPPAVTEKVCMECKRHLAVCVMVTQDKPCMGPVTLTGCGAICPRYGRDCYACFGPAENVNMESLGVRFQGFGLLPNDIANRFLFINSGAKAFNDAGKKYREK